MVPMDCPIFPGFQDGGKQPPATVAAGKPAIFGVNGSQGLLGHYALAQSVESTYPFFPKKKIATFI